MSHDTTAPAPTPELAADTPPGRVLVTGATGAVGGALVDELGRREVAFRVLCRRPDQVADFRAHGVDAALGSLDDEQSLVSALRGCDQLFLLAPVSPDMEALTRRAIDAAVAAGVRHVAKVSASDARPDSPVPWAAAHARTDAHLARSGLARTELAATCFTSNLLQLAAPVRRGFLPGTSGRGATTWITPEDLAAAAARVLTDPAVAGGAGADARRYLLTGTRPLSFPEVAAQLSEVLGRRVRYVHLPGPLMYVATRLGGSSAWEAHGLVAQFAQVVRHGRDGVGVFSDELAGLLDREPTSVADYVRAHAASFG